MKLLPVIAADPYVWPRDRGVLPAWMLRHYARWLLPQLQRRWINDDTPRIQSLEDAQLYPKVGEVDPTAEPYRFTRAAGICRIKDLRHFGAYALEALVPLRLPQNVYGAGGPFEDTLTGYLQPMAEPEPYIWIRSRGLAMVRDLKRLNAHIQGLLDKRKEPVPDPVYLPPY